MSNLENLNKEIESKELKIKEIYSKISPFQTELHIVQKELQTLRLEKDKIYCENVLNNFQNRTNKEEIIYTEEELKIILEYSEKSNYHNRLAHKLINSKYSNEIIQLNGYYDETYQTSFKFNFIKDDRDVGRQIKEFIEFILPYLKEQKNNHYNSMFRTFLEKHGKSYKMFTVQEQSTKLICLNDNSFHLFGDWQINSFLNLNEAIEYCIKEKFSYYFDKNNELKFWL